MSPGTLAPYAALALALGAGALCLAYRQRRARVPPLRDGPEGVVAYSPYLRWMALLALVICCLDLAFCLWKAYEATAACGAGLDGRWLSRAVLPALIVPLWLWITAFFHTTITYTDAGFVRRVPGRRAQHFAWGDVRAYRHHPFTKTHEVALIGPLHLRLPHKMRGLRGFFAALARHRPDIAGPL